MHPAAKYSVPISATKCMRLANYCRCTNNLGGQFAEVHQNEVSGDTLNKLEWPY